MNGAKGKWAITIREAADWSGLSVKTLRRAINRGLLKKLAAPVRRVLIAPSDLEAFLLGGTGAKHV